MTSGGTVFCLVIFMAAGIFAGIIWGLLKMFVKISRNNVMVIFSVDFFCTIISCLIFYILCVKYFYADIKFYYIVCFLTGIVFETIFIENLIAKPINFVYNKFNKLKNPKKGDLNERIKGY